MKKLKIILHKHAGVFDERTRECDRDKHDGMAKFCIFFWAKKSDIILPSFDVIHFDDISTSSPTQNFIFSMFVKWEKFKLSCSAEGFDKFLTLEEEEICDFGLRRNNFSKLSRIMNEKKTRKNPHVTIPLSPHNMLVKVKKCHPKELRAKGGRRFSIHFHTILKHTNEQTRRRVRPEDCKEAETRPFVVWAREKTSLGVFLHTQFFSIYCHDFAPLKINNSFSCGCLGENFNTWK